MCASRRWWLWAPLSLSLIAFEGCAAKSAVHSYVEPGVDLGRFHRFAWAPDEARATGDPRLDNNEIVQTHIRTSVEKQLSAKGLQRSTSDAADLLVHYHASVAQRIDLSDREPMRCVDCKPFVYDAGTIVVDLVDARSGQVLWRGWSEGNIDGVVSDQRWLEDRIDSDVSRMFRRLPR